MKHDENINKVISEIQAKRVLMDLTPSLICQVFKTAENSPSVSTCSIVKWLGSGWTQAEWSGVSPNNLSIYLLCQDVTPLRGGRWMWGTLYAP